MQKLSNKRFIIAFIGLGIVVISFAIYALSKGDTKNTDVVSNGEINMTYVSGLLVEKDSEDLKKESMLIVRGKVIGQSDPFEILPVFGDSPSIFTDYYIEVYEILRGDCDSTAPVTVRIQGGIIGNYGVYVEDTAELNVDDEVLLFLYAPGMGSGYNTKGDYYYVLGELQGAFFEEYDDNTYINDTTGKEIDMSEFAAEIELFNANNPVNENLVYEEFLENQEKNLESGFITQEEYYQIIEEASEYAAIID